MHLNANLHSIQSTELNESSALSHTVPAATFEACPNCAPRRFNSPDVHESQRQLLTSAAPTATSQMVPNSARSEVARAKPSSCPRRAHRDCFVARTHTTACVFSNAVCSFPGSRRGKPTCD